MSKKMANRQHDHEWIPAAANDYEICQLCKDVRKKQEHVLPVVTNPKTKKEEVAK